MLRCLIARCSFFCANRVHKYVSINKQVKYKQKWNEICIIITSLVRPPLDRYGELNEFL